MAAVAASVVATSAVDVTAIVHRSGIEGTPELAGDPLVDLSKVKVSVANGVATISGVVENWEVYNAVLEHVFEALPLGVVNQLERRKPPQLLYSR